MSEFNQEPEPDNTSHALTAAEAYRAGGQDTHRAIKLANTMLRTGAIKKEQFAEGVAIAFKEFWEERVKAGELPEILS